MNYLAHIFLSNKDPKIMMGNFLGDLANNKEYLRMPDDLKRGVQLHRKIDTFTDNHPIVENAVRLMRPHHKKYAPVVVDIFYDYLLFHNWATYSDESIQDFANWSYEIILDYIEHVPERNKLKVNSMVGHNWLLGYGLMEQLHQTFLRVKKRARFDSQFELATKHLKENLEVLNDEFNIFMPELIQMTQDFITKD